MIPLLVTDVRSVVFSCGDLTECFLKRNAVHFCSEVTGSNPGPTIPRFFGVILSPSKCLYNVLKQSTTACFQILTIHSQRNSYYTTCAVEIVSLRSDLK